jgi:hypothetical protein
MASFADVPGGDWLDARHIASLATENPDGPIPMVAVWCWFDGTHALGATSPRRAERHGTCTPNTRSP